MGTCGASCGITKERDRQKDVARALVERLCDAGVSLTEDGAFTESEVRSIARTLGEVLPCRACVVEGDRASWIYLTATLAPTSWIELREGCSDRAPEVLEEVAVRVGLSTHGRYATLQEVRLSGAPEPSGYWVEEARVAGVEDRRLQLFVKAAQGLLRKLKVVSLDAAFLMEPAPETSDPRVASTHGAPTLWSALFDADPTVTSMGVMVFEARQSAVG